jgi:hypothetical protein
VNLDGQGTAPQRALKTRDTVRYAGRHGVHPPIGDLTSRGEAQPGKLSVGASPCESGSQVTASFEKDMMARFRHKKRGGVYEVLTDTASLQCSTATEFEDAFGEENWTVYRNVKTGAIYVRLTEEFNDGRFERVTESQPVE